MEIEKLNYNFFDSFDHEKRYQKEIDPKKLIDETYIMFIDLRQVLHDKL